MDERELPTNKIHDYVTWPKDVQIFDDGRGGLAFPGQNNSNCRVENGALVSDDDKPVSVTVDAGVTYGITDDSEGEPQEVLIDRNSITFTPSYSIDVMEDYINVRVLSFTHNNGSGTITVADELPQALTSSCFDTAKLRATTPDTLERTALVTAILRLTAFNGNTITYSTVGSHIEIDGTPIPFILDNVIPFELVLQLNLHGDGNVLVYASNQDNPETNGVYKYTAGHVARVALAPVDTHADQKILDALADPTVNDNVPCCDHYRKAYSHREVYDATRKKVGEVTSFGVKSYSLTDCDGGLVDWFTSNGEVNLGNGHGSVFVTGFGLGQMYNADTPTVTKDKSLPNDAYDENDTRTLHPWLTWSYGTRYDAQTSTNICALPRDWPFTNLSSDRPIFNQLTDTSNITLVKKCFGSEGVGNLERDVEEEIEDPVTHETSTVTYHVFNNRHHIVLYPDYRQITGQNGYKDGSVVVKPLFIHLPASIDTKDGETVDITMSIQNVDQSAFGDVGSQKAAMSGYYAAMTQPRVYVMGGVQFFSNKKLNIKTVTQYESTYIVRSKTPAYKNDGKNILAANTRVRTNIVAMPNNATGNRRTFTATGYVVSNSTVYGAVIQFDGKFPYPEYFSTTMAYDVDSPVGRRMKFIICGMAYLVVGDNPTSTPMGLMSREPSLHRNEGESAGDAGAGGDNDLDCYNKFYAINSDDEHKVNLPNVDKRYLLATVYQTATSTFPWAIAHRRKLASIAQSWTDEIDRDRTNKSLLHLIYLQNRNIYETASAAMSAAYPIPLKDVSINDNAISYCTTRPWTSIASYLRVKFAETYDKPPVIEPIGNPVRVARKTIRTLMSDFKRMRLLSLVQGNQQARVNVSSISINPSMSWPNPDDTLPQTISNPHTGSGWVSNLVEAAWQSTLRNLPEYIMEPTHSAAYPLFADSDEDGWFSYINGDSYPYKCNERTSSAAVETLPYAAERSCATFSNNSVIDVLMTRFNRLAIDQYYTLLDARRYAETYSAIVLAESNYMDANLLGGTVLTRYTDPVDASFTFMEAPKYLDKEWMNPFTNIQSIDTVPYPAITLTRQQFYDIATDQRVFASADAVQMYRYEYQNESTVDTIESVSSVMPTESDLAKFLESYVTAYASKLPLHQYHGTRVLLQNGKFPAADSPIYIRTVERVKKRMELGHADADMVAHYINDSFCTVSATTRDPNVDRLNVSPGSSIGVSAPPYVTPSNFSNQTYTRVYMQFTFSQKAGRWYTTEYRQYPTNYLSPLYGADALDATLPSLWTIDGQSAVTHDTDTNQYTNTTERNIWRNALCDNRMGSYRSNMYIPYSFAAPMDITLGCVPYLLNGDCVYDFTASGHGKLKDAYADNGDVAGVMPLTRLEKPYLPLNQGGLGLYPPANVNGGYSPNTNDGVHANFWSVRQFVRPAVSVLPGTDVPRHEEKPEEGQLPMPTRKGGFISDPTLYGEFDFPTAGKVEYKIPSTTNPDDDMAKTYLLYHQREGEGIILGNTYALGYGISESDQHIDRN